MMVEYLEAMLLHVRVALRECQVGFDHLGDQFLEADSGLPAQLGLAFEGSPSSVSTSVGRK